MTDGLPRLDDAEFARLRAFVQAATGIRLPEGKRHLVASRLWSRLRAHGLASYGEYASLLEHGADEHELALAVDALTTHETSFFREEKHFPAIERFARAHPGRRPFRVWSAACSTGEEVWSLAMTLAQVQPAGGWEVVGTDVSPPAVALAERGLYTLTRAAGIPKELLRRYCRRGQGRYEGHLLIDASLRAQTSFSVANLCEPPPPTLGRFDLVLLRNVLIYFEPEQKKLVVRNAASALLPGGHFLTGHAESATGLCDELEFVAPTVHRKVAAALKGAA